MRASRAVLICALLVGLIVVPGIASATPDAFTGAWAATDTDGSTLSLLIGEASPSGARHVTLVDQVATTCGAPATAVGFGSVSGSTLVTSAVVRCGGVVLATDVPITYTLVGDTLIVDQNVFTRRS